MRVKVTDQTYVALLRIDLFVSHSDMLPCNEWFWTQGRGALYDADVIVARRKKTGHSEPTSMRAVYPTLYELEVSPNIFPGMTFVLFGKEWTLLEKLDTGRGIAIAEEPIFNARFDPASAEYDTSEIKRRLESWFAQAKSVLPINNDEIEDPQPHWIYGTIAEVPNAVKCSECHTTWDEPTATCPGCGVELRSE